MKQNTRRLYAIVLTLCMVVGLIPATVFAAGTDSKTPFVSQQLMLGDDLTMNFGISIDDNSVENTNINVTLGEDKLSYAVKELSIGEDGNYIVSVDVAAAQMTESIKLEVVTDGVSVAEKTYTVRGYADAILNLGYNTATKDLVKAMLNYGAQAQIYFDYNKSNLANAGYEYDIDAVEIPDTEMALDVLGSVSGINLYGTSMIYTGKMTLRYYFKVANGVEGYNFTANGKTYTAQKKNDLYYVDIIGINPQNMDEVVELTVSNGAESLSVSYSPMHYIIRMSQKGSETLKSLLKAMYAYYQAAEEYVASGNSVISFATAADTAEDAIAAFELAYPGHELSSDSISIGENILTATCGGVTYDLAFYWEVASSMQGISGIVADADTLTGSTYAKVGTITNKTTFTENDTVNITGTAGEDGFVYFYWKTNQMAICDGVIDMDMRLYAQNNGGMAEWQYDTATGAPRIPFAEGEMTVVDLLEVYDQYDCGYWMLNNQVFSEAGNGMYGLGVGTDNGMVSTAGPNESITEDGTQFWVIGFRIYVGSNQQYNLDLCLAGSGDRVNSVLIPSYLVAANSAAEAIAAFEAAYPGYKITTETINTGVNTVAVTVGGYTYDMPFYWEKTGSMQRVSGIVADADTLTGSTYTKVETITNKTTFTENDTVNITGTANEEGFVYFYWKTNQMAICDNFDPVVNMRLYVQNNGGMAEWQHDTASGLPRIPFASGAMTVVDLRSAFQDSMCCYWMLANQQFNAAGNGMNGMGVGNSNGIIATSGPNESINEDGTQYWIIGFRIYVGSNQQYNLDLCLAGYGERVKPVLVPSYATAANSAAEAIAAFEAAHPGYDITTQTINLGVNTVSVTVDDYTYDMPFYWEKAGTMQSVSGIVADAATLAGSTYAKVGTITNKTTFTENDTINITGTSGEDGFVYFYWKTNQMAICDSFDPVVNMRLYARNNGGMAEWQHDTATGAVARIPFASGVMTAVDLRSAFQENMCSFWMLANQQFSANGNGMFGLGVGNSNGIVATSGPNESVNEDGTQYWIIGFRIYVGSYQQYNLDLCIAGYGEKVKPVMISNYATAANSAAEAIAAFERANPGYDITTEAINLGVNTVSVTVDGYTYDMLFYWEKAGTMQSISGIVADAATLAGSTHAKVGTITNKTTFTENDTINITGTSGEDGFVYFYWKTNQMAICDNFDPVVNMRLYAQNNGGMAEWQHDTATGAVARIPFASGAMTVVDLRSAFQDNMCSYWMLANQQFSANGNGMFGLGVGNSNGIVATSGPNESVNEDGTQYWIIGFRIYVGSNQQYNLDLCLVGTGTQYNG